MTRFDDYTEAVENGSVQLLWKHELIGPDGTILATTDAAEAGDAIRWGAQAQPLESAGNQVSQRTLDLSVPLSHNDLLPKPGGILHPDSGSRVRTSAGIVKADGTEEYWTQSTLSIFDVEGVDNGGAVGLDLHLVDGLHPVDSDTEDAFKFDDGELVSAVVGRLAAQVLEAGTYSISETDGCVLPTGSLSAGTNRYSILAGLLEGCGHELTATATGQVISREILPSWDDSSLPRWRYGAGQIAVGGASRLWQSRVPQAWKIEGGSFASSLTAPVVLVYDTDPASEGYYRNSGPAKIGTTRLPFVQVVSQAAIAGYAQLRRFGTGPGVVRFGTIPNPALRVGDLLEMEIESMEIAGTFRVQSVRLPVQADGLMTVTARFVFDPALEYDIPNDRGPGCLVSISDPFDRPDQNLENLEGSAGSPDWTEIGYSWYIQNEAAIQRFANGWSLAFVNTPLCSSNQSATVAIGEIPSGRRIGPAVRSSAEFDCYTALADSAGNVTLEMWRAGGLVDVLGSHSSGGSVAGRNLTVRAVGTTIQAQLNSETVITATDDRRTGSYVGMLAYGGATGSAPSAESFTAGAAS